MQEPSPNTEQKTLSYGQRMVGLTFNPSGDETVNKIKTLCAEIIDTLKDVIENEPTYTELKVLSKKGQLCEEAINQIITGQMWAVKGITFKN